MNIKMFFISHYGKSCKRKVDREEDRDGTKFQKYAKKTSVLKNTHRNFL